jgi:predicted aspartyl protease
MAATGRAAVAALLLALMPLAGCAVAPDPAGQGAHVGADACRLEKLATFPVTFRRNVPVVDVRLDGGRAAMILDTGAAASLVTRAAAERLSLPADGTRRYLSAGIGGVTTGGGVRARALELDAVSLPDYPLVLGSFPLRGWGEPPLDGLLGNDVLQHFDVELDLSRGRVVLYRPRVCASAVPPWDEPWIALRRPDAAPDRNLVYVPVELDGRALVGFLDSGAMATVVHTGAAAAIGVDARALAADGAIEIHGAAPVDAAARVHRFHSLRIGPDEGTRPALLVATLPPDHGDVLVGVGYLRGRRVWISYATQTVFVGRVGGGEP